MFLCRNYLIKEEGSTIPVVSLFFFLLLNFQGSLEETNDDKSAMQLIGLILLKYYRSEVLEPYLKLLCSSGLRSDDEGFKISKKILWRIIQRHMVCFKPAMAFYAVNIDIEDERGKPKPFFPTYACPPT